MNSLLHCRYLKQLLIALLLIAVCGGSYTQAGMIATSSIITADGSAYSQADLQTALQSDQLKAKLQVMGVDVEQLQDRITSLTADEIQQLNAELEQRPAGGILGTLVTIFIVFVITDMLCATDLFTFVSCINK